MLTAPPNEQVKIATFRIAGLEHGRIAEFALEGVESPAQPVKIGRFALTGIGVTELMRNAVRLSALGREPEGPDLIPLLRLLEGVELKDFSAPDPDSGKTVQIDAARISWGGFVGALPSRARVTLRLTTPLNMPDEQTRRQLAAAGFSSATIALDVGLEWNEAGGAFTLSPGTAQVMNFGALEAHASLRDVSAALFSSDPTAILIASIMVEVGPLELAVRDLGGIDIAVAQLARQRNVTPDAARQVLVETLARPVASLAADNPDFAALADAIGTFINTPRGTLSVRVAPKGPLRLLQLVSALEQNPEAALADFHIEAAVSKPRAP
jgi:hypothetical protein